MPPASFESLLPINTNSQHITVSVLRGEEMLHSPHLKSDGILSKSYEDAWADEDTLSNITKHLPEFLEDRPHLIGVVAINENDKAIGGAIAFQNPRNFITKTPERPLLESLLVDIEYRRKGIGTKLVSAVRQHFNDTDLPDKKNLLIYADRSADGFYQSIGARYTGERRLEGLKSEERRQMLLASFAKLRESAEPKIPFSENTSIKVRKANLEDAADRKILVHHELAQGISTSAAEADADDFIKSVTHGVGFISEVNNIAAGSVFAHDWPHYTAKETYDETKRHDIVAAAVHGPRDTGTLPASLCNSSPLQSTVILSLLERLVSHAGETGHTQINIDHSTSETANLLDKCGFVNGLRMELKSAE